MSQVPNVYLPSGHYFVSNRHCPLKPGKPNSKIDIPFVYHQRHTWKLTLQVSVPEDPIYILSDADDTLFLGTTTTPNPDIEGIPPVGLPTYATTTLNKDEAWRFKVEQVFYTHVDGSPTEFPCPIENHYILVQAKDTGKREVLTVVPPTEIRLGTLGTVEVQETRDGEDPVEYVWGLEFVLRGPPAA